MGVQRTSFEKLQRDRAKKAKAAAKREKRLDKPTDEPDEMDAAALEALASGETELSAADLLILIEQIHKQFDAEEIDFEEFEERKSELLARLPIPE
jgi:ABC-type amino acid transport substrate-binding protein